MKTKKNFLKKLSAVALGFVMTLGVGAAGYAGAVTETHAATEIETTPVTSVTSGEKYVIGSSTSGSSFLGAVSGSWGSATTLANAYVFTAEGSGASGFALKCTDGYLTPKTANSNTFSAYGNTSKTIQLLGTNNNEVFSGANNKYNLRQNGTSGFRWYGNSSVGTTGNAAYLYKVKSGSATFTVTYNANGATSGSVPTDSNSYTDGASVTVKTNSGNLQKTNYTFDGWNTKADGTGTTYVAGTGTFNISTNTTLYAKWKSESAGDKLLITPTTLDIVDNPLSSSGTKTVGIYTFYAQTSCKNQGDTGANRLDTTEGVILLGKSGSYLYNNTAYENAIASFKMYWGANAGTSTGIGIQFSDTAISTYSTGTHTFTTSSETKGQVYDLSSYLTSNCKYFYLTITSSANAQFQFELTFKQSAPKHSVTYSLNGGSGTIPTQSDVAEGSKFTLASSSGLTKTGHTFAGWNDGSKTYSAGAEYTMGTSDVTLTAQWSVCSYALTYDKNGGEGTTIVGGNINFGAQVTVTSSTYTKEGYTQDGWSNSSGLNNTKDYAAGATFSMPASTKTLYAHWKANTYTVTFDAGDGSLSGDSSKTVTYASTYGTLPGASKDHYDFNGWYTAQSGGTKVEPTTSVQITANQTLYAQYSIQSHTVLYNGNGGTADKTSDTVQYGKDVDLTVGATYPGFTLLGWALSSDATVGLNSLTMEDSDITLYAVWEPDERTYAFNAYANDGVTSEPYHIGDYNNGADITMPYFEDLNISRSGYTALGWSTTSTGEVEYDEGEAAKMGDSALNIYVVWQKHLDEKPTLTLSGSTSMWVGKNQTLTINYTSGAETLNVSASPAGVVSLTQTADTGSVRTYTVAAIAAGEVTITAGDSFYSDSVTITSSRDYLDKVIISGSLPSGTYYEGDALSISTAITNLSISGKNKSGDSVTISKNNATWTFADGSSSVTLTTGMTKVTVVAEYEDVESNELELPITVTANVMESLTVNYTGGQPVLGTTFSFAGSITANMSKGTHPSVNLSDVAIGAVDRFSLESQTITVTHKTTGATGTFNVQYKVKEIETQVSWVRCTKVADIVSGETYILGYEATAKSGSIIPMVNTLNDGGYMNKGDSITMSSVSSTSDYEVKIVSSTVVTGDYCIKVGNKYISNQNAKNSCGLVDEEAATTAFNLSVGDNDVFTFKITANTTYHTLSYNTSSPRFAVYAGTQKNLVVYKKVETPIGQPSVIKIDASLKAGKTFSEGDSISASDFDVSALYDTGTTGDVTATSVTPTKLGPGNNTITVNYNSFSDTVVVSASEIAHLDRIEVVDGTGQRSFERLDDFNSTGLEVMAYYSNTDKTKFPDHKVTNFTVDPAEVDMDETGTYAVGVSYTENGVTKSTSYNITITPKTSTYVTIEGDGIQGSSGVYTLTSPVQNTVDLLIDCDGDEEIIPSTESSFLSYVNGQLIINSSTKTSETGSITFSAGSASATLTVTVTAAETIQLISDAHVSGFIGDELAVNIALGNVASATWTLPSASDGFTVKTTSKDNTGFVGTISVSEECTNKEAVFSVVTGKGETLSVSVYVSAQVDAIDSISATCSKSYVAGQDSFDKSDLTVTYERLSGATGTLSSDEFTVTGAPTGKLARTSYNLTITSNEGSKTCNCTISASMPSGLNAVTSYNIPGTPSYQLVTSINDIETGTYILGAYRGNATASTDKKYYAMSGNFDKKITCSDVSVSNGAITTTEATAKGLKTVTITKVIDGANTYYTVYNGSNYLGYGSSGTDFTTPTTAYNWSLSTGTNGSFRLTSVAKTGRAIIYRQGTGFGGYATSNVTSTSDEYYDLELFKYTPGQSSIGYTNHESMSGTMFDFINRWGGTELTAGNWGDIFGSDEYKALTATDKEWFKNGVAADDKGTMESCELFAEFITKYDEVLATNDGLTNYLNRTPVEAYTITIDYNHDGQTSTIKAVAGEYKLPEAPTYEGYVFQGWLVNGETKGAGSTITVSGNMMITAQWVQGITFSSEFGFKFTGLDITRFQLIFNGTCPDDAKQYGFLYTKSDIDLTSLSAKDIEAGVTGVGQVTGKNQAVLGTSYGYTEVSVVFYYIDGDGQVHYSEVIKTSFDEMAQKYDLNQITDPYARLCLEYYLANFAE